MNAILNKVIPLHYDKSRKILYFSKIKGSEIDTTNFKYLKEIKAEKTSSGELRFETHYINFKKIRDKDSNNLDELVSDLYYRLEKGRIDFGIPLSLSYYGEISYANIEEQESLLAPNIKVYKSKKDRGYSRCPRISQLIVMDVKHGLSVWDENERILYDCGGLGISWTAYRDKLRSYVGTHPFKIIISHFHFDHYRFLKSVMYEFNVEKVICNWRLYDSDKFDEIKDKFEKIDDAYSTIGNWEIFDRSSARGKSSNDVNYDSLILLRDDQLLVGDQHYDGIDIAFTGNPTWNKGRVDEFILPHHGRGTSGDPSWLNIKPSIVIFSDKKHEAADIEIEHYTSKTTKIIKARD